MKKFLFLCFSILFTNFTWSQVIVNAPSNVEVGFNNSFGFYFLPTSKLPPLQSGTNNAASSYKLTSWFISSISSNMNNSGYGNYNNNSQALNTYTLNQSQSLNFPIKWEDNSNSLTDIINFTVNVTFYYPDGNQAGIADYPGTYTVNVNRIFPPTITNSTFASCSTANVQICAVDYGTANQFNWAISGGTITSGQGSSCINVTPTLSGNLTATCTVKRSSGLSNYTRTTIRTINRDSFTSAATITGNAAFCTSSSYTLSGLLPNQTVQWSLANPTFGTLSATTGLTTTFTGTKQGDVTLNAKITNSCGEFITKSRVITVGVNGLIAVLTTPSGYQFSTSPYNVPESCSAPLYVFKTSSENTNFNNPTKKMQFTCNGITIVKLPVGTTTFFLYASDFNINEGNSFVVTAKVGNSCGFAAGSTTFTLYRPTPCQCGVGNPANCPILPRMANNGIKEKTAFKLYPNPSNDVINIELDNTSVAPIKSNASIYNMFGVQVDNFEILENKATFNVRNYIKGVYILKINTNGIEENHQIIVK